MQSFRRNAPLCCLIIALATPAHFVSAQQNFDNVQIEVVDVAGSVKMLVGQGGNIGLSAGNDGVFLVDDQFAPLTEKILAAVATVSDKPVRFVVNTHWHGDHTGGNENLGAAGAVVVAHENVRARMSTEQFLAAFNSRVPPSPEAALPVITFTDAVTFHWNDDTINVFHVDPAHTDGDAIIHFVESDAMHMGDTYFNGRFPFIDVGSGGSIDGIIAAVDRVLSIAGDDTKIIPGHGALSNRTELNEYREMLVTVRARVQKLIDEGKSREEVVAAKPTVDLDAVYGQGFMQPDVFVGIVYDSLTGE